MLYRICAICQPFVNCQNFTMSERIVENKLPTGQIFIYLLIIIMDSLENIGNMRFIFNWVSSATKKEHINLPHLMDHRKKKTNSQKNNQTFPTQFHQISDHLTNRKGMQNSELDFRKNWIINIEPNAECVVTHRIKI